MCTHTAIVRDKNNRNKFKCVISVCACLAVLVCVCIFVFSFDFTFFIAVFSFYTISAAIFEHILNCTSKSQKLWFLIVENYVWKYEIQNSSLINECSSKKIFLKTINVPLYWDNSKRKRKSEVSCIYGIVVI